MYLLLVVTIIMAFVLFFWIKNNLKKGNIDAEKLKLDKDISLKGLAALIVLFLYDFINFTKDFYIFNIPFKLSNSIKQIVTYIFVLIAALLFLVSAKMVDKYENRK